MKTSLAQTCKLLFLTFLLVLPMMAASSFLSVPSFSSQSPPMTPIVFETYQSPSVPKESKFALLLAQKPSPEILGIHTSQEIIEEEKESQEPVSNKTGTYTIALLGDSMIDVMQTDLPQLASALKKYYPQAQFKLLNYGVGATNIEYGLARLTQNYTYLGKDFPSLLSQNPDIVVVESFAYNHWGGDQKSLNRQWLALGAITDTIKNQSQAKIVLAATIGPDENTLCDGIEGIYLFPEQKRETAQVIRAYLQNIINFANSQGYPLADAYHPSLDKQGNGQPVYINVGDHLHPSGPGGELLAGEIAEAIYQNKLF